MIRMSKHATILRNLIKEFLPSISLSSSDFLLYREALLEGALALERCLGCNSPLTKCGPELWKQQKKCCPDCSHTEDETNSIL